MLPPILSGVLCLNEQSTSGPAVEHFLRQSFREIAAPPTYPRRYRFFSVSPAEPSASRAFRAPKWPKRLTLADFPPSKPIPLARAVFARSGTARRLIPNRRAPRDTVLGRFACTRKNSCKTAGRGGILIRPSPFYRGLPGSRFEFLRPEWGTNSAGFVESD